ncbi:exopolyphosphatase/guanosine-5'-triphosphate,3'-diphosphate pyrophosphatase [Orbus hercynius]|uniref:Exopolyphosphatase/guanosine-5'-triphosphate, 3'-diphosphate pyrophosphatase n=1 Tax=Orbus hercynius TaxID=593135 RepID=A0A495RJG1_9GAMM|nr:exopolyphosphatase [Orbus hercynius]RKS87509.1 exopolyphosphatase/guanosine-5'-triphosphate,3'-diphosphate pyrophosphatase [Orbus hercynius]
MQSKQHHNHEYAIMDLGSNSFHMIIMKKSDNALQVIYKNKQNIHLATGLNSDYFLSQSSIQRGVACLAMFAERLANFPASHVKVIGTYALRVAKNRHQFLTEAAKVFPYPIEIVSGQEEARLIYLGAINNESVPKSEVKFVIDVGGGSTEIAIGKALNPTLVESRPMGCVTYAKQFFPDEKITRQAFEKARFAAEQQVEKIIHFVKNNNIAIAFGASGTIKSIYNILLDIGVSDGIITPKRLDDLVSYILEFNHFDDINYPSLSNERKRVFVSGLAIFYGVFKAFGLKELHYTQSALREGVLYEMIGNNSKHQDIYQKTIDDLSKLYRVDELHAKNVALTAQHLMTQWRQHALVDIDAVLESILDWAAQLHEIGLGINFSGIHKHSAYILQHSNMPGFNEEQQFLLSTLVKYHRKSFKLDHLPYFSLFEKKQIYPLLQILRLSVLINNQRSENLDPSVFKLTIIDHDPCKMVLMMDKTFAKHNRLVLFDLEQEQQYWRENKPWQLDIQVVDIA